MTRWRARGSLALFSISCATFGLLQCGHSYGDASTTTPDAAADAPAADAPTTTTPEASTSTCNHALPPANGTQDDAPGVNQPPFWLVFDSLAFPLPTDAGVHAGFDLDDTCTCLPTDHDGAAPCVTPAQTRVFCDYEGGVDDGVATAVSASFGQYLNGSNGNIDGALGIGGPSELLYITGYNGTANDPQVGVALVRASALVNPVGCDGGVHATNATTFDISDGGVDASVIVYAPLYDGCDRYAASPGAVVGTYPTRAPLINVPAYVVNHQLVAQLPKVDIPLGVVHVELLEAFLTATIAPQGSSYRLDNGVLAGRLEWDQLLSFVGRTPIGGTGAPVCESPFWPGISPTLCSGRDTMASPSDEFQGKICDSATIGTGFSAKPTQVDDAELLLPESTACPGLAVECQ